MRRAYVALIVLATVFSMAWYKLVMQRSLVVCHGIFFHLSGEFSWHTVNLRISARGTYFKFREDGGLFEGDAYSRGEEGGSLIVA